MKGKLILVIHLIIALSLLFIPFNLIYGQETPSVTVDDQEIGEDNMVTIAEVVSPEDGWIVIHQADNGDPGPAIGYEAVQSGTNTDVMVEIDQDMVTDTLFAMLHEDTEPMGEFTFPDGDPPTVDEDGNVVMESFEVTMAEPEVDEPEEPDVVEPDVDEPDVDEPDVDEPVIDEPVEEELPETGYNFLPFTLIGGILLIIGALGVLYLRSPKQE